MGQPDLTRSVVQRGDAAQARVQGCTLATPAAVDTRFAVEARPAVQELGARRTSFVRRRNVVPRAVDELHRILAGLLPGDLT